MQNDFGSVMLFDKPEDVQLDLGGLGPGLGGFEPLSPIGCAVTAQDTLFSSAFCVC